jgi:hypothetical protein
MTIRKQRKEVGKQRSDERLKKLKVSPEDDLRLKKLKVSPEDDLTILEIQGYLT